MDSLILNRKIAQLALLQRIELASPKLKKIRKIFGRYLFSKVFSKYLINIDKISKNYSELMLNEFLNIKESIKDKKNFLSIGAGIGGLELIIMNNFKDTKFSFIEKNYISNKIKYGWDNLNQEGYNDLYQLKFFLKDNNIDEKRFDIFDFDDRLYPKGTFDVIMSIYSLDYHYDFNLYFDYLKKVIGTNSILIFDTIRPDYFKTLFKDVEIIKEDSNTIHSSKRIVCKNLL